MHGSFATFIVRRVLVVGSYYNASAYTGSTHFANSSLKPQQSKAKPHMITRFLISPHIEGELGQTTLAQRPPTRPVEEREGRVGCSQNYGPLSVMDYITAPNIWGYPNRTLIFRN